eukprot:scaffold145927_cov19-Tisochrysis_lutea.AAC.1
MPHHSDIISQKQRTKAVCVLEPCAEESIVVDAPSHHRSIASMSSSGSPDVTRSLIFPYHQMSPDLVLFQVTSSNLVLFQLSRWHLILQITRCHLIAYGPFDVASPC